MLQLVPFAQWLAPITTLVMLAMLAAAGELHPRGTAVLLAIFLVAAYCQFFSPSPVVAALGLGLQTLLAVALVVRWRWSA
jgi:hypothetical protein